MNLCRYLKNRCFLRYERSYSIFKWFKFWTQLNPSLGHWLLALMCTCKSAFPSQCGNNFLPFIFYVKSISTQFRSRDSKCQKFQSLKLFVIFRRKIHEFTHCVTKSWKLCSIRWGVTQKLWKADVIKKRERRKLGSCVFSLAYIVFFLKQYKNDRNIRFQL